MVVGKSSIFLPENGCESNKKIYVFSPKTIVKIKSFSIFSFTWSGEKKVLFTLPLEWSDIVLFSLSKKGCENKTRFLTGLSH